VGLSSVVGGECAGWAAGELVDVHGEGQREESLGDALCEPREGLGEVGLHPHLALERGEHRLDHEPDAGLRDLARWALTGLVFVGDDQIDIDELEAVVVLSASMAGVGEQECAGVCCREPIDALALVLVGGPPVSRVERRGGL